VLGHWPGLHHPYQASSGRAWMSGDVWHRSSRPAQASWQRGLAAGSSSTFPRTSLPHVCSQSCWASRQTSRDGVSDTGHRISKTDYKTEVLYRAGLALGTGRSSWFCPLNVAQKGHRRAASIRFNAHRLQIQGGTVWQSLAFLSKICVAQEASTRICAAACSPAMVKGGCAVMCTHAESDAVSFVTGAMTSILRCLERWTGESLWFLSFLFSSFGNAAGLQGSLV
jgi:hypothetical protein